MLKLKLSRDLRKNILRGHPWVYGEALQIRPKLDQACMASLLDKKGKFLAWVIYDPHSSLAVRILSLEKKPPNENFFYDRFAAALDLRKTLMNSHNNCLRLFNGEGDGLAGLICDVYRKVAVIQFDGLGCFEFWDRESLAQWLLKNLEITSVYFKPRRSDSLKPQWWGEAVTESVEVLENNVKFAVDIINGQKTGFFLDQRDNRKYLQFLCYNKRVLNLFSYTGGFSVYAGLGGAKEVTSVDIAPEAIKRAEKNWQLNGLKNQDHQGVSCDVFEFLKQESGVYDVVIVDPPSMTHSEKTKTQAMKSYIDLFSKASHLVEKGQHLVLSSCSSHISFDDFFEIIDESLSASRRTGKILRVSGQGVDHPFPHYCRELRYLKFVHLVVY